MRCRSIKNPESTVSVATVTNPPVISTMPVSMMVRSPKRAVRARRHVAAHEASYGQGQEADPDPERVGPLDELDVLAEEVAHPEHGEEGGGHRGQGGGERPVLEECEVEEGVISSPVPPKKTTSSTTATMKEIDHGARTPAIGGGDDESVGEGGQAEGREEDANRIEFRGDGRHGSR